MSKSSGNTIFKIRSRRIEVKIFSYDKEVKKISGRSRRIEVQVLIYDQE